MPFGSSAQGNHTEVALTAGRWAALQWSVSEINEPADSVTPLGQLVILFLGEAGVKPLIFTPLATLVSWLLEALRMPLTSSPLGKRVIGVFRY